MSVLAIACPKCGAGPTVGCRTGDGLGRSTTHTARRKAAPKPTSAKAWCDNCGRLVPVSKPGRLDYHDRAQNQLCPGSDTAVGG